MKFFRTLKEQGICGLISRNDEEVRQAEPDFVETYNHSWRLERPGYMSHIEYPQAFRAKMAA